MNRRLLAAVAAAGLLFALAGTTIAAPTMSPTSGSTAGGTVVNITGGAGFTVATTVTFTGLTGCGPVGVTAVTPDGTGITFVTPACPAGLYIVTTSNGSAAGLPMFQFVSGAPGPPTKLVIAQQPTDTLPNAVITPPVVVQIQDASGNLVSSSSATVTMAIGSNPGGGTLAGTTTVAAVAGVATFADLSINVPGMGYTLVASSAGLTSAISVAFNITGPPLSLAMTPTSGPPGTVVQLRGPAGTFTAMTSVLTCGLPLIPTALGPDGSTLTFVIPASCLAGSWIVQTSNPFGVAGSFLVTVGYTLTPGRGPQGTFLRMSVAGAQFMWGATAVSMCGRSVSPEALSMDGRTLFLTVPACPPGTYEVMVSNVIPGEAGLFTVPPIVSPDMGSTDGGQTATLDLGPQAGAVLDGHTMVTLCDQTLRPATVAADGASLTFVAPRCKNPGVYQIFTTKPNLGALPTFTYVGP